MSTFLISFVVIVLSGLGMALGLLARRRPLERTCGVSGGGRDAGCGLCDRAPGWGSTARRACRDEHEDREER